MLTQETITKYQTMIQNGQAPTTPEEIADYEVVKAMMTSTAMAATSVTPATVPAPIAPLTPVAQPEVPVLTPANGSAFSMEDAMKASMAVDKYLRVRFGVTSISDEVVSNDPIYVKIDIDSVVVKQSIKAGSPVKYLSSIDGKTCLQGGTWVEAIADMQKIDPKARPYFCVDLAMEVVKDVKAFDGTVVAPVGTVIGHTTATTNWKDWLRFYQSLPTNHTGSVYARLTRQDMKKDNNSWGLVNFQYVTDEQAKALGLV